MNKIKLLLKKYNITNYALIQFIPAIILLILFNYTYFMEHGMKYYKYNFIVSIGILIGYIFISWKTNCLILGKCKKIALLYIFVCYFYLFNLIFLFYNNKDLFIKFINR